MVGTRMDGILVADEIKSRVAAAVDELLRGGISPCLATVLVGDDPASATYVKNKHTACKKANILTKDHRLESSVTQKELNSVIDELNSDPTVHGILVQLPLSEQLDEFATTSRIVPTKDVDGLHPYNVGMLAINRAILAACTPSGIMTLLEYYNIDPSSKRAVIINRSNLIGKPLAYLLTAHNATVTICHSKTPDIASYTTKADIVISGVGNRSKFTLTPDMISEGTVVIDAAIQRHNYKLVGDSDYDSMIERASYLTPVPGGVGPMTVAMLLKNTVTAASLVRNDVTRQ